MGLSQYEPNYDSVNLGLFRPSSIALLSGHRQLVKSLHFPSVLEDEEGEEERKGEGWGWRGLTSEDLVNVLVLKLPELSVAERVNVAYWISTTKMDGTHLETLGVGNVLATSDGYFNLLTRRKVEELFVEIGKRGIKEVYGKKGVLPEVLVGVRMPWVATYKSLIREAEGGLKEEEDYKRSDKEREFEALRVDNPSLADFKRAQELKEKVQEEREEKVEVKRQKAKKAEVRIGMEEPSLSDLKRLIKEAQGDFRDEL